MELLVAMPGRINALPRVARHGNLYLGSVAAIYPPVLSESLHQGAETFHVFNDTSNDTYGQDAVHGIYIFYDLARSQTLIV